MNTVSPPAAANLDALGRDPADRLVPHDEAVAKRLPDPVHPVTLSDGEVRFYRDYGFLIIPGLLSESFAGDLRREVLEIIASLGGTEGKKLQQCHDYLVASGLDAFVHSTAMRSVASQLLGGPGSLYLPFTAVKGTGGGQFHFHQDNNYTRFTDGLGGINLWTALTPMSPDNGCLNVAPMTHLAGNVESEYSGDGDAHKRVAREPDRFLPVRMRPGDCVAFTRLTIHGSGANSTPDPRVGYALQYFRDDVTFVPKDSPAGVEPKLLKTDGPFARTRTPVRWAVAPTGKVDGH